MPLEASNVQAGEARRTKGAQVTPSPDEIFARASEFGFNSQAWRYAKPQSRQARYKAKWRAVYVWLIVEILGGICAECGEQRLSRLTVDHRDGKNYDATGLSTDQRARIYLSEYNEGVRLQCLCHSCNSRKGHPDASATLPF
jgi:hypothetical protein